MQRRPLQALCFSGDQPIALIERETPEHYANVWPRAGAEVRDQLLTRDGWLRLLRRVPDCVVMVQDPCVPVVKIWHAMPQQRCHRGWVPAALVSLGDQRQQIQG